MTGCFFNLDPITLLFAVPIATDALGQFSIPFGVPSAPWTLPDMFVQFVYLAPGVNPAGIATTEALQIGPR